MYEKLITLIELPNILFVMKPAERIIIKKRLKCASFMDSRTDFCRRRNVSSAIPSSNSLVSKFLPESRLTKSENLPLLNSPTNATLRRSE